MKKKKSRMIFSLLMIGALLFCSAPAAFAAGGEGADLIKEYKFDAKSADNLKYDAPEKIKEGGSTYELSGIDYEVIKDNTIEVVKDVRVNDPEDLEKTITEEVDGKAITLTANTDNIEWSEATADGITKVQEYSSRSSIPASISSTKPDADGNQIKITLEQTAVENISKTERFSAPAVFYSPSATGTKYSFNSKVVTISGGSPVWSGYQADVKSYLGLNGSTYKITGGSWASAASYDGSRYVRQATYTGTRTTPLYRATFTETADTTTVYTASVTYTGTDPDAQVKAKAIARYDKVLGLKEYIMIGAGVLVLAILAVVILILIRRRKKTEYEES